MIQKSLKPNDENNTIAKLNELYITTRRRYLVQYPTGYVTKDKNKYPSVWMLNDGLLKTHLDGLNTYGIFNGNAVNKFITFDVDFSDKNEAEWVTFRIIELLINDFKISRKDIHVSVSGSKGYHVDLFFNRPIPLEDTRAFYDCVVSGIGGFGGFETGEVEFRPTYKQGVKLPLGIHQVTGNRCWFVDNQTLEPIESFNYLDDVEPMDADIILDAVIELTEEQEAEFAEIEASTDTTVNIVDTEKAMSKAVLILDAGRLLASNTRHVTTLTLASFYNSQGLERGEAIDAIMTILHNTPREYFSEGSTPEHWQKETERLVNVAFDRNYTLGNADKPVTVYKSEILAVLGVGTFRQKQLAYAMLMTSKRYGTVFYLTMGSAKKMMGTKSNETVTNSIKKLVKVGFIQYERKKELDKGRSKEIGHAWYKPNKYRLLIAKPIEGEKSVEVTNDQSLVDVTYLLCDMGEIVSRVKRSERENRWARNV